MRSNLFANLEEKFRFAGESEITQIVQEASGELLRFFDKQGLEIENGAHTLLLGIVLGCQKGGMTKKREKLFRDAIGVYLNDVDAVLQEYNFSTVLSATDAADYLRVTNFLANEPAHNLLYVILGFAYVDGGLDDDIAKQIDAAFGMNLLADFIQSGETDVPAQRVYVSGLEEEITDWFAQENRLIPLSEIKAHFSGRTGTEVQSALDSLVQKDILYGGENMIMNMYGLVSQPAKSRTTASKTKRNTTSSAISSEQKKTAPKTTSSAKTTRKAAPAAKAPIEKTSAPMTAEAERELWKNECKKIDAKREEKLKKRMGDRLKTLKKDLPDIDTVLASFRSKIEEYETEKNSKQTELTAIQGFKPFAKAALKLKIQQLGKSAQYVKTQMVEKEAELKRKEKEITDMVEAERYTMLESIKEELPYPSKRYIQKAILEVLHAHEHEGLTITEIHNGSEALLEESNMTIIGEIAELEKQGKVFKYSELRRTLFRLA